MIRNCKLLDGSGRAAFDGDLGIKDGKIAAVGAITAAQDAPCFDAHGRFAAPGFIDIHRHADLAAFRPGFGELELRQGLTTIVNGNCGLSAAPFGQAHRAEIFQYLTPILGSAENAPPSERMDDYLTALRQHGTPIHVGMLTGAGVLRADVAGYGLQRLGTAHYNGIHRSMEQSLADGAFGISLGLGYAPECFYTTKELIRALAPLQNTAVPITVHMRKEGSGVAEGVEEMLNVARALHCPLHISHLKAMGKRNRGIKIPQVLTVLQQAREDGLDVSWDVYPYTAGSTQLLQILPTDFLQGGTDAMCERLCDPAQRRALAERLQTGTDFENISLLVGWENIRLSSLALPEHQSYTGKSVAEIAEQRGQTPEDCIFDLLAQNRCNITMIDFITCEEDIARILRSPQANVISDATYPTAGAPHPRLYGTFARIIEVYVCREHMMTLEEAVAKMTSVPAQVLGLRGKGRLAVGYDADVLLFDAQAVHECSTYLSPAQFAVGFDDVLVGGAFALRGGKRTDSRTGTVLRSR